MFHSSQPKDADAEVLNACMQQPDRSESLVNVFEKPRVERHDGGHFVPSKKSWRDFFALYMRSIQQGDDSLVPSPGQSLKVLDDVAKF